MSVQGKRREALRTLAESHGLTIGSYRTTANEDISEFFGDDPTRIERWAAVTAGSEIRYIYPLYQHKSAAVAKAIEHIGDSMFAEYPVAVVNLDTGRRYRPRWSSLVWRSW